MPKLVILLIAAMLTLAAAARDTGDTTPMVTVSGVVKDKSSKKKLANVSISVPGTGIATVSNADGAFTIKIPTSSASSGIIAEQVGYFSTTVTDLTGGAPMTIWMRRADRVLGEVVVRSGDPTAIVREALKNIPDNYSQQRSLFSAFYRETIQKRNRFIGVTEGVVDVYKTAYDNRTTIGDRVQLMKGRKLISQNARDTVAVKIVGGPTMPVFMDFVKNEEFLFSEAELPLYRFEMDQHTSIDDRMQYVIRFEPVGVADYPLCVGRLYIDQETLSFSRAEFQLDMRDKQKVTEFILRKKPRGLRFTPQESSFVVTYRNVDGKSYLNYISSKTRFKCDWKRRLFASGYTAFAEVVMVDRHDEPFDKIERSDAFGQRDIFYDEVDQYWDEDFWRDYNIIEPTERLETAVLKLRKKK